MEMKGRWKIHFDFTIHTGHLERVEGGLSELDVFLCMGEKSRGKMKRLESEDDAQVRMCKFSERTRESSAE